MTREEQARADWLKQRRELLTASDVAAVLGVDPRRGPLAVYLSKVGDDDPEATENMMWGRDVETAIAKGYARQTGRPVFDLGAYTIQKHPDIPWLGATLDRATPLAGSQSHPPPIEGYPLLTGGKDVPVELKAQGFQRAHEWTEDPPQEYQVQLQLQMACTGARWGSLCALLGGVAIVWKDFLRDDDFLKAAFPKLEEFWLRVVRRDPPEADALPGTSEAIKRHWREEDGSTVALESRAAILADMWEAAALHRKEAEDEEQRLKAVLMAQMGAASFGALADGTMLSLRVTKNPGYTRKVEPYQYRVLRRLRPRLPKGK